MLLSLSIQNIAIVEDIDVAFGPGLNVLTGETGAGKSIVFRALGLLLGERATVDLVRTGTAGAAVEGRFAVADRPDVLAALAAAEVPVGADGALVLRRTVPARGSGRASANGRPLALPVLASVGERLLKVAGQHAHQRLLDPDEALRALDRAASAEPLRGEMTAAWAALSAARSALTTLEEAARHTDERQAWLRFQTDELSAVNLRAGEHAALADERRLLRHATELSEGARAAEALLYSGDDAAADLIARAEAALRRLAAIDPALGELADGLREAGVLVGDAARALSARDREVDPGRLDEVEERMATLERLARKHRCDPDGLREVAARLEAELGDLVNLDERLAERTAARDAALAAAVAVGRRLRAARRAAATRLGEAVTAELVELAMPHARFSVVLGQRLDGEGAGDGERLGESGLDAAELHLSANPGEEPRALARVASGGELSRVLLALETALAGDGGAPFLFDEIGSGVGGAAAEDLGRKLASLAAHQQVICITHLPQIAGLADVHLAVSKDVAGGRTRSRALRLDLEGRVTELARMLGGASVDDARRRYAAALLQGYAKVA